MKTPLLQNRTFGFCVRYIIYVIVPVQIKIDRTPQYIQYEYTHNCECGEWTSGVFLSVYSATAP